MCVENGQRLFTRAQEAYVAADFGMAVALAIIALEELGKAKMLDELVLSWPLDKKTWGDFWRRFRVHGEKVVPGLVAGSPEDIRDHPAAYGAWQRLAKHVAESKFVGLYVDLVEGKWRSPLSPLPENSAENARDWLSTCERVLVFLTKMRRLGMNTEKYLQAKADFFAPRLPVLRGQLREALRAGRKDEAMRIRNSAWQEFIDELAQHRVLGDADYEAMKATLEIPQEGDARAKGT